MKLLKIIAAIAALSSASGALGQEASIPNLGEVVVTSNRGNAPYYIQDRPVIGLRRQADSAVQRIIISSDSRDYAERTREIHTLLLSALDRASGSGLELVSGYFELTAVTKDNYKKLSFSSAGRIDTSKVDLMIKAKLGGSADAAQKRIDAFIKAMPKNGRASIEANGILSLTIINPDQYRDTIIKLVSDNARRQAAVFGPDYAVSVSGIDGQVNWSQVSDAEVFVYIPYHYAIVPK